MRLARLPELLNVGEDVGIVGGRLGSHGRCRCAIALEQAANEQDDAHGGADGGLGLLKIKSDGHKAKPAATEVGTSFARSRPVQLPPRRA